MKIVWRKHASSVCLINYKSSLNKLLKILFQVMIEWNTLSKIEIPNHLWLDNHFLKLKYWTTCFMATTQAFICRIFVFPEYDCVDYQKRSDTMREESITSFISLISLKMFSRCHMSSSKSSLLSQSSSSLNIISREHHSMTEKIIKT